MKHKCLKRVIEASLLVASIVLLTKCTYRHEHNINLENSFMYICEEKFIKEALKTDNITKIERSEKLGSNANKTVGIVRIYRDLRSDYYIEYENKRKEIGTKHKKISEDTWRKELQNICIESENTIKYVFGMKSTYYGWDEQYGLDCSGFVEYVYNKVKVEHKSILGSTIAIADTCEKIDHSELKIGDLGMIFDGGTHYINSKSEISIDGDFDGDGEIDFDATQVVNHVGIYMGKQEEKELWAHCNYIDGTIKIAEYEKFKEYYRVKEK